MPLCGPLRGRGRTLAQGPLPLGLSRLHSLAWEPCALAAGQRLPGSAGFAVQFSYALAALGRGGCYPATFTFYSWSLTLLEELQQWAVWTPDLQNCLSAAVQVETVHLHRSLGISSVNCWLYPKQNKLIGDYYLDSSLSTHENRNLNMTLCCYSVVFPFPQNIFH